MTPRELVFDAAGRFSAAELVFGHGTDNAYDEAVFLVFHALGIAFDVSDEILDRPLGEAQCRAVESIVTERISTRRPAAYITGRMWFAGHEFHVDDRVLVPRSPLAEVIGSNFAPWLDQNTIHRVLEIGTGSGCVALATASALPQVKVDATDNSREALAVAALNLERFPDLGTRVRLIEADLFPPTDARYDLIVTNPPYVPTAVTAALPPEYQHEPSAALDAGADGLAVIRRILQLAPDRLTDSGALIVDVGEMADTIDHEFQCVNFTWIDLEFGGEGIGIAYKRDFRT